MASEIPLKLTAPTPTHSARCLRSRLAPILFGSEGKRITRDERRQFSRENGPFGNDFLSRESRVSHSTFKIGAAGLARMMTPMRCEGSEELRVTGTVGK